MKIAIIGATGFVGNKILEEALKRNYEVTAIARNTDKISKKSNLTLKNLDINNDKELVEVLKGNDVVISSVHFLQLDYNKLANAIKLAKVNRWLIVGGAGSLEITPGLALIDTPEFPEAYKAEASAARDFLNNLNKEDQLSWTFLSPSAEFIPGEATGKFRLQTNQLIVSESGRSYITNGDYAIAMLDEVGSPKHIRQRFTVGY